ncbi:MAG: PilW family protein, partial [Burkholderiaceae bacterium]
MAPRPFSRRRQLGVTVLELMIGMTIGLIASVVIVQVYSQSEAHRRTTSGLAGSQQGGTIAAWQLLRDIRMAGSGLQHGPTLWGCKLQAWRDGGQILPRSSDWPQPFGTYPR